MWAHRLAAYLDQYGFGLDIEGKEERMIDKAVSQPGTCYHSGDRVLPVSHIGLKG